VIPVLLLYVQFLVEYMLLYIIYKLFRLPFIVLVAVILTLSLIRDIGN
jgi:hypothetical protein